MSEPIGVPAVDPLYADIRRRDPVRPALIVDVRERHEFARVRLEGSRLVPMSELERRRDAVPRDRPVLVICATGNRSTAATHYLLASGWTDVANVAGGITAWERLALPVRRGPLAPGEGDDPG